MFSDIFANIVIVASFLFLIGQIIKDYPLDTRLHYHEQTILGVIYGALGIALMSYAIHATDTVIFDLRNISIISAGIIGGPVSIAISSAMIAAFRMLYFGINTASVTAAFIALAIGISCAYISGLNLSKSKKFFYMFLFSMFMSNGALIYLIRDQHKLIATLSYYWPIYILGAVIAYYAIGYIVSANENFKSMAYYRMVADNQRDMISTHLYDGTYAYVSPSSQHLLGYEPDELIGMNTFNLIHPEDIKSIKESFWNLFNGLNTSTQTYRVRTYSGKYIWVESSVRCIRNKDGTLKEIINTTRDITLRKQIEQQLKISNARFKAIFENAGIGIVMRDINGKAIEANPAYLAMTGYTKEEIYHLENVIHPQDLENELKHCSELVSGSYTSYRSELCYLGKNREKIYADVTSTLVPGTIDSPTSVIRVVNNITERKKLEKTLRESEERFRTAFDNAAIGVCISSLDRRILKANLALCEILGFTEEELIALNFNEITHQDDIDKDLVPMNQLLAGEITNYHIEKRYFHKNGEIIWALLSVSIVKDADGSPLHYICQVQDITLKKQAEEELKKAKQKAEKAASIDYLTGVLNRRAFINRFSEEFNRALREKNSISLVMADIDHFKKINDTYGHQAGDLALQRFAQCLSNVCRPYDFLGRHGGEEFIICLPTTSCEQASLVAERMRAAVESMCIDLENGNKAIGITASFGISSPIDGIEEDMEELIDLADKAMYKAKVSGRNRVCTACKGLPDETTAVNRIIPS